jgi:hypothetical protein
MRESAVVVGAEATAVGDAVVRQGAMLAQAMGASLHVITPTEDLLRAARAVSDRNVRIQIHKAEGDLETAVADIAERVDADAVVVDRASSNPLGRALAALRWRLAPRVPRTVRVIPARCPQVVDLDALVDGPDSVDWVVAGP